MPTHRYKRQGLDLNTFVKRTRFEFIQFAHGIEVAHAQAQAHDMAEDSITLNSPQLFRKDVYHKRHQVWRERDNTDLYTGKTREEYLEADPDVCLQVDHVLECQIAAAVWDRLEENGVVKRTTKATIAPIVTVWNDLGNLNNTSRGLNLKKRDVFTRFVRRYVNGDCQGLKQYMQDKAIPRQQQRGITRAMAQVHMHVTHSFDARDESVVVQEFAATLEEMIGLMKLEDCR